jgi:hypothetical protein
MGGGTVTRPTVKDLTGKPHLSYSSLDTFQQCGEKYRLSKVYQVPQEQAWWFVGGSAVHKATELYDLGDDRPYAKIWADAWVEETEKLDMSKPVRVAGRATKYWPNKEDAQWWDAHGLEMLVDYARWRKESRWELLTDGENKFIEWEFTLTLPNPSTAEDASPELVVQGYVDRVFVTPDGEVVVCDIKTGSREPASSTQLGIYAAGLRQRGNINPAVGTYFMGRKGDMGQMRSLLHYTDDMLAYWLSMFEDSVRSERFMPHVTSMCQTCTVAPSCYAVGGKPPYNLPFVQ